MFIHIWMHWFWITAAYLKGFLLLTVHTVSLSEAQLLNDTFAPPTTDPYNANDSSQADRPRSISPPALPTFSVPQDEPPTTGPEDAFGTAVASPGDMPDTFNGGALDAVQYPLKKFTKYTHPKYAKARTKEKLNVSMAAVDDATPVASEMPSTVAPDAPDVPDAITTGAGEESDTAAPTEDRKDVEILKNETLVIESKVEDAGSYTTVEPFLVKNRVAAATSGQNYEAEQSELNPGSITGITLGILVVFSLFGAVSFVLYRRRYLNKPEVLHDKCSNLDSSGYIDETSLRENSEEMYSLDNDSFLNSLEAMTIQNYWTESVKHTKL